MCALLDEPTPNSDPTGASYAFEKGATKASGGGRLAEAWEQLGAEQVALGDAERRGRQGYGLGLSCQTSPLQPDQVSYREKCKSRYAPTMVSHALNPAARNRPLPCNLGWLRLTEGARSASGSRGPVRRCAEGCRRVTW